jgi:hypothetical protein
MSRLAGWTADEERAVLVAWEKAMQAMPDAAIEILILWFQEHSEAQEKFRFAGMSANELRNSPRLASHATKILCNLNIIIICRNKPAVVQELLDDLKRDHSNRHVAKCDNESLLHTIIQYLTKAFGKGVMNDNAVTGFSKLMNLVSEYTASSCEHS